MVGEAIRLGEIDRRGASVIEERAVTAFRSLAHQFLGWEPITHATTNNGQVYIERYGQGNTFYLTLRNMATTGVTPAVSVDLAALGLSPSARFVVEEQLTSSPVPVSVAGNKLSFSLAMPAESTRILRITGEQDAGPQTYNVPLAEGWNLVALPGTPEDDQLQTLLAPLAGQYDRVYAFDAATQSWRSYHANLPYAQQLTTLAPGQGFWIHALADTTWSVRCKPPDEITLALQPGWNLVGYPLATPQDVAGAVAALGGHGKGLYSYVASASDNPWRTYFPDTPPELNSLTLLEQGKGYWIEVDAACHWTLRAAP